TTEDHLGSPRMETLASSEVWSQHDYMPFGEEIGDGVGARAAVLSYVGLIPYHPYTNGHTDGLRAKFTGQQRDTETGMDYSIARYYSSGLGRFTSSDEFTGGPDELYDFAEAVSSN